MQSFINQSELLVAKTPNAHKTLGLYEKAWKLNTQITFSGLA
jgi:hypothetical protein